MAGPQGWSAVFFGIMAGCLSIVAFFPYIVSILKGSTRPNRATWLIWTGVGLMIASSYYAVGARHTVWAAAGYAFGPLIVSILSIRHGVGGWERFDRFCLAAAGISLLVWGLTGSPAIGLATSILVDAFGALPTLRKSYFQPESENRAGWTIGSLGALTNLFAIESWGSLEISVYPIYMLANTGLITAFVWFSPRRGQRQWAPRGKPHFGEHLMLDGYGGNPECLNDKQLILDCLHELVGRLGMNMLADPRIYRAPDNQIKDPGGWSCFVVIAESHISIHTFPARRFVSADIYTCKAGLPVSQVRECLENAFQLQDVETNYVKRGTRYPDLDIEPEFIARNGGSSG